MITTRMIWQYASKVEKHPAHLLTGKQVRELSDCAYCGACRLEHCTEADGSPRCSNHFERVIEALKEIAYAIWETGDVMVDDAAWWKEIQEVMTLQNFREAANAHIDYENQTWAQGASQEVTTGETTTQ